TFVVPVSLDMQSQGEQVEASIEETTNQDALPTEPLVGDVSGHEPSPQIGGSGEFYLETEVASQGPVNEVDDLKEIEQMLNEDSPLNESAEPVMEGDSMDNTMNDGVQEKTAIEAELDTHASVNSEVYYPEFVEENPVVEPHIVGEGMSNDSPIEPSADVQAQEKTIDLSEAMPIESAFEDGSTEADFIQDYAADHPVDEQGDGHATEAELELEAQHL
ncbi:MAG: hypothetical protein OEY91_10735, partial [Nitrospirota bacterium]|nr:hypothetical protein [Nitrospirota bacterium]